MADHYREQHFPSDFILILKTKDLFAPTQNPMFAFESHLSPPFISLQSSFLICGLYEMSFHIQIGNGAHKAERQSLS